MNGNKLYEIVKLNGEGFMFDYVTSSKRKIEVSELYKWFRQDDFGMVTVSEKDVLF